MMSLTNLPKRCVSVGTSSQSGTSSSDNSVASASDSSTENPFVMLVDAATSLLDKKNSISRPVMNKPPMLLDVSTSVLDNKRGCRMTDLVRQTSTPPLCGTVSPPVTATTTTAKIPAAVEVKATPSVPIVAKKNGKDENKKQTFAELLMSVLDDPAHQEVMCWMPDGKAFTIRNHKKFTMDLMPKLFNIRNMSSFVRKLGRWGFSRVHEKETRNSDIFKHKNFHRGDWELCKTVKCVGRDRIANKPTPSTPTKTVIDLVGMEYGGHYHHHHPHHSPYHVSGSPTILRTTHAIPVRRIPSPPAMVTPPSGDKALLRLEHARRLSAHSRPSAFRSSSVSSSSGSGGKGLGNMTNEVMEAAIETLRRDEETVIVAMPKKYLQSRSGPPPGVRVLSTTTTSSSGSFGPPTSYPVKTFSRSSFVRHAHNHQSTATGRPAPVSLNTRPTNSGAAAAANHSRPPMMAQYRERTGTNNSYAINRPGGYRSSSASPSYQR